jgi:hypothetical protein
LATSTENKLAKLGERFFDVKTRDVEAGGIET